MVDLAKQAFSAKNFNLAAEIYERSIVEYGPKPELLLGLADSLAKCGQFEKAFTVYSKASRVGPLSPSDLKHLVGALVNTVKQETPMSTEILKNNMFDCLICRNFLSDPVTIPCGHTFCRTCVAKDISKQCKTCGTVSRSLNVSKIKTNFLMQQIIEKWFPNHCKAVRLKERANKAFQMHSLEEAVCLYSEAIAMAPNDHILLSNRSHALTRLDRYHEALADAEKVLKLRPDWPKGYFRRGCALYGLQRFEESVVALLQCLALDSSIETAKDYLSKALHSILTPLAPDDPKAVELQRQLNPTLLNQLIHSNFNSSLLLPQVTVDTVRQLKEIISDTITSASSFLEGPQAGASGESTLTVKQYKKEEKCASAPSSRPASPSQASGMRRNLSENQVPSLEANSSQEVKMDDLCSQRDGDHPRKKSNIPHVEPSVLNKMDLECSLCYRLLHDPVTPPCGHVFCRSCLDRCLDHKSECPLCKSCLAEYLAERRQAITSSVENILKTYFPLDYEQRCKLHEEELAELSSMGLDNEHDIPVFVCTIAYPMVPCPLHIFEPKYRLMIRQCMESGRRQFGMCIATGEDPNEYSDFGCMLEIRNVQYFQDGRSLVDCIGGRRFKVMSRGQRDGYSTAKVEYLTDKPPENVDELHELSKRVYGLCMSWYEALQPGQRQQINQHLGNPPLPETDNNYGVNGTAWHWWMIAVMPLDPRIQIAMLAMSTYKERLLGLNRVVGYLRNRRDSR